MGYYAAANGNTVAEYDYGPFGEPVKATGPAERLEYDGLHRLVARILPDGATTRFEHNPMGQETRRILPGGMARQRAYDPAGRLVGESLANPARADRIDTNGEDTFSGWIENRFGNYGDFYNWFFNIEINWTIENKTIYP